MPENRICLEKQQMQLLKHSSFELLWNSLPKSSAHKILTTAEHIYCVFSDNIIRQFDRFGNEKEFGFSEGDVYSDNEQIWFVQNGWLCQGNNSLFKCDSKFVVNSSTYVSNQFLDGEIIGKYENFQETYKSQIFKNIKEILPFRNGLIAYTDNILYVLDSHLNIINEYEYGYIKKIYVNDKNNILVIDERPKNVQLLYYDPAFNLLFSQQETTSFVTAALGEFIVYSLVDKTIYTTAKGDKISQRLPCEIIKTFEDRTEHTILVKENNVIIVENETNIITWAYNVPSKILDVAIDKLGIYICTENGEIYTFGGKQWGY